MTYGSTGSPIPYQMLQAFVDDILYKSDTGVTDIPSRQGTDPETQATLDKEIMAIGIAVEAVKACADERLLDLYRRRNQLSHIYHLPNEILSSVFQLVERTIGVHSQRHRFLLDVSSVSHLWRQVALSTPRLWTCLSCLPKRLVDIFIDRSKHAALSIEYGVQGEVLHFSEFIVLVSPHTDRWRTCHLNVRRAEEIPPFLQGRAPDLEKLYLDAAEIRASGADSSEAFDHVFARHTPRLRELQLDAIFVPFTHPIYSGLTTLHLGNIEYLSTESIFQLLRALEGSPLLEELHLFNLRFFPSSCYISASCTVLSGQVSGLTGRGDYVIYCLILPRLLPRNW